MGDSFSAINDDMDEYRSVLEHFDLLDRYKSNDCYSAQAGVILSCYRMDNRMTRQQVIDKVDEERIKRDAAAEESKSLKERELLQTLIAKHGIPRPALVGLSAKQIANPRTEFVKPATAHPDQLPIFTLAKKHTSASNR